MIISMVKTKDEKDNEENKDKKEENKNNNKSIDNKKSLIYLIIE